MPNNALKTPNFQFKNAFKCCNLKKKHKIFLNKGTKHKKNYIEGIISKNKNIKGGGSP